MFLVLQLLLLLLQLHTISCFTATLLPLVTIKQFIVLVLRLLPVVNVAYSYFSSFYGYCFFFHGYFPLLLSFYRQFCNHYGYCCLLTLLTVISFPSTVTIHSFFFSYHLWIYRSTVISSTPTVTSSCYHLWITSLLLMSKHELLMLRYQLFMSKYQLLMLKCQLLMLKSQFVDGYFRLLSLLNYSHFLHQFLVTGACWHWPVRSSSPWQRWPAPWAPWCRPLSPSSCWGSVMRCSWRYAFGRGQGAPCRACAGEGRKY